MRLPGTEAADRCFTELDHTRVVVGTTESFVELREALGRALTNVAGQAEQCAALLDAAPIAPRLRAAQRGDVFDLAAHRVESATVAMPSPLQSAARDPRQLATLRDSFNETISENLGAIARDLRCLAVEDYESSETARARAQLDGYGAVLVAECHSLRDAASSLNEPSDPSRAPTAGLDGHR